MLGLRFLPQYGEWTRKGRRGRGRALRRQLPWLGERQQRLGVRWRQWGVRRGRRPHLELTELGE